jgi:hypothetical protein
MSRTGLEIRDYSRRDPSLWPRGTLYPQKFAITSQTSSDRSVGIVRLRTKATEFSLVFYAAYIFMVEMFLFLNMVRIVHCSKPYCLVIWGIYFACHLSTNKMRDEVSARRTRAQSVGVYGHRIAQSGWFQLNTRQLSPWHFTWTTQYLFLCSLRYFFMKFPLCSSVEIRIVGRTLSWKECGTKLALPVCGPRVLTCWWKPQEPPPEQSEIRSRFERGTSQNLI